MKEPIMVESIQFKLNGEPVEIDVDPDRMLLWVLRTDLALTGTKYGCGESHCGACTVLVNNLAVKSCSTPVRYVSGREVVTIEGLAGNGKLHPLQKAFMDHDALQCGYCTPGMILAAYSVIRKHPHPSPTDIVEGMNDNFCRCGAHKRIIEAIQTAAKEMRGGR
jgi:aerobic-type carbon monoxide dehydrogenase small subunit (CoxS/CutS family)